MGRVNEPFDWIRSHLERLSYKWSPRTTAKNTAKRISQLSDKRTKFEYQCNMCKDWFKGSKVQIDHIVPKGKYSKETFFIWLDKLFCKADGFQVLCIPCHLKKTNHEKLTGQYK